MTGQPLLCHCAIVCTALECCEVKMLKGTMHVNDPNDVFAWSVYNLQSALPEDQDFHNHALDARFERHCQRRMASIMG